MKSPRMGELSIEDQVRRYLDDVHSKQLFVGYSGGLDSTALLYAVHICNQRSQRLPLTALYFEHGLQSPDKVLAQAHCVQICEELNVPLLVGETRHELRSQKGNLEANARALRYEFFAQHVGADDLLLLAHHADDQLETMLMRLFQGRGLMQIGKTLRRDGLPIGRPLLGCSRADLGEYLQSVGLTWWEDPSNADTHFDRNFLRHEVIPRLRERWPRLMSSLLRVTEERDALSSALRHTLIDAGDVVAWSRIAPTAPQAWLRAYLAQRAIFHVSDRALTTFYRQGCEGLAQLRISAEHGLVGGAHDGLAPPHESSLYAYDGQLYFESPTFPADASPPDASKVNTSPGSRSQMRVAVPQDDAGGLTFGLEGVWALAMVGGQLELSTSVDRAPASASGIAASDGAAASCFVSAEGLSVTTPSQGERIQSLPDGRHRRIAQLLAEARVPPWRRAHYPIVKCGDEVVCVPGIAVACANDIEQYEGASPTLLTATWRVR